MVDLSPFVWGTQGERLSPADVARKRELAQALLNREGSPQNVGEGIQRVTEALLHNKLSADAAAGEQMGRDRAAELFSGLQDGDNSVAELMGAMGDPYLQDNPGQSAVVQALMNQQLSQQDPMHQMDLEKRQLELDALRNPAPKLTDDMREYEFAVSQGFDGTLGDWITSQRKAGATNVNVGDGAPGLGKLSTDFGYVLDPETGEPVIDANTGLPTASAIPGSPAALEAEAAEVAAETKKATIDRGANIVIDDVNRALAQISANPSGTTGIVGSLTKGVPGMPAQSAAALLQTIKANAGFDRLQQMRDSSVTGGALGAINKTEMDLLQAAIGNLEQDQPAEQLIYNMKRVKNIYLDIIHGAGEGPPRENLETTSDSSGIPEGIEPEIWEFLTPEERALWQN